MLSTHEMMSLLSEQQKKEIADESHKKIIAQIKAIKIQPAEIHLDIQEDVNDIANRALDHINYDKLAKVLGEKIMTGLSLV